MTVPEPDLQSLFSTLAGNLGATDIVDALSDLVYASTHHTAATEGGVVLADADGVLHVMASTSERVADVEEAQLGTREGPCLDCVRSGEPIEVADLNTTRDIWPDFSRIAEDRGFRAVHATPMRLRGVTLGSLCLFSPNPEPLSDRDAALVQTLANAATLAVLQQHSIDAGQALTDQLQYALDSRVVIEQAKGALSQQMGISIDDAFTILRQQARYTGRRLRDVAAEIIQTNQHRRAG